MDLSKMTNYALVLMSTCDPDGDMRKHTINELARRLENAEAKAAKMLEELDAAWSFDKYQCHTHTWHTKQDFLNKWRATDAASGGAE